MKNYYTVLGVQQNASEQEIKSAYRKLARQHHPDVGGDEDSFKTIAEAYEILGDPVKKKVYDNKLRTSTRPFENPIFSEFFHSVFNAHPRPPRTNIEKIDIMLEHRISIYQLFQGTKETIHYKKRIIENNNEKFITVAQTIEIKKGAQQKDLQILVGGGGHESKRVRGKFGHLAVIVRVLDDPPLYIKRGNDIQSEIPIPLNLALVGSEIKVPTLHGLKTVNITPHDCFFRKQPIVLKGCGLQRGIYDNSYGDHHLYLGIETPQILTEEQKEYFRNMPTGKEVYPEYNKVIISKQERS